MIEMTGNKEVITGGDFRRMITGAYSEFLLEYENLNQLDAASLSDNGAVGTNILRTMGAAAAALADAKDEGIGGLSKRIANAAVLGARGNAGVVLAQMLRGIAKGLAGKHDATSSVFGKSFQYGILYAQRAIPDEKERPIITIARAVAKGAYQAVRSDLPISEILAAAIKAGTVSIEKVKTETAIDDVGGKAVMVFLQGCIKGLDGNFVSPSLSFSTGFKKTYEVPDPKNDLIRAYCLTVSLDESKADAYDVERVLNGFGSLVIVKKKANHLRVHLHTDHPGLVIEQTLGWGRIHSVVIDNIAESHVSEPLDEVSEPVAVLAVAGSEAVAEELQELGATVIIESDAGSSPSVGDFVNAVHSDLADKYIFLPNSKSLNLVLRQVKRILGDRIAVLDVGSAAEQVKALSVYKRGAEFTDLAQKMQSVLSE